MTSLYGAETSSVAPQPLPDKQDTLALALQQLAQLPELLRQTLTDHQWSTIPLTVEEFASLPAAVAGSVLSPQRQVDSLVLIQAIIVIVPTGAVGTLQLGNTFQLAFPAGVWPLPGISKLLQSSDIRSLTITGGAGGPAAVWLMGQQLPTFGVLGK